MGPSIDFGISDNSLGAIFKVDCYSKSLDALIADKKTFNIAS